MYIKNLFCKNFLRLVTNLCMCLCLLLKKNFMALFMDEVQLPQGYRATSRREYFLTPSSQKVLVFT